ncbi:MAG: CHAP domain-containing protein [Chthonomonadales bacterium]|nr:CHAP domain-containing protein [Chthonomonadales bacterium]
MKELVQRALETAKSQLGVREEGENRGPRVSEYLTTAGVSPGNPWCAAFVYWCVNKAAAAEGVPNPFVRTAYCPTIAAWARDNEVLHSTPQAGDVFLRYGTVAGEYRASHTGFVTAVDGSVFSTIEGNTNIDGSREGIGVFARKRVNGNAYRFVRWGDLLKERDELTYKLYVGDHFLCDMPVRGGRSLCPVRAWGQRLGFEVGWNQEEQVPLFDGHEVTTQITLIDGQAYAPVRDLATSAGLRLRVDNDKREVHATRI